ncbi:unnamed protein product [Gongylonema pulchrum]|uniref:Uncharacterized protein n=1 Tax=Gongylonema pulchrum TaxID=637853 RepID=A0A183DKR0_9BILA|nr:unnamed protein product [Gongylonema pulchrum]
MILDRYFGFIEMRKLKRRINQIEMEYTLTAILFVGPIVTVPVPVTSEFYWNAFLRIGTTEFTPRCFAAYILCKSMSILAR